MAPERLIHKKCTPRSGPTGGHEFTRLACVNKKRTMRCQKRLCGNVLPARRSLRYTPRAQIRALRGRSLLKERFFSRNSVDLLPDTAAGVRAEREDQGIPAADLDSPVETPGCSAPSFGAPGDSDLPSITASEHASTHAHARTELPLATAAEPRKP